MKKNLAIILGLVMILTAGCLGNDESPPQEEAVNENEYLDIEHPIVEFEMADGGIMVFELYPEYAPETVENFTGLVESGFYDGLTFHRIVKGFMIQGGDPEGNGTGGSGTTIRGEFSGNGFSQNTLKHTRGIISMARSRQADSASSQFFIMEGENSKLDGSYAAFGKLIDGEETLSIIADREVKKNPISGEMSLPVTAVIIKKVTLVR